MNECQINEFLSCLSSFRYQITGSHFALPFGTRQTTPLFYELIIHCPDRISKPEARAVQEQNKETFQLVPLFKWGCRAIGHYVIRDGESPRLRLRLVSSFISRGADLPLPARQHCGDENKQTIPRHEKYLDLLL